MLKSWTEKYVGEYNWKSFQDAKPEQLQGQQGQAKKHVSSPTSRFKQLEQRHRLILIKILREEALQASYKDELSICWFVFSIFIQGSERDEYFVSVMTTERKFLTQTVLKIRNHPTKKDVILNLVPQGKTITQGYRIPGWG